VKLGITRLLVVLPLALAAVGCGSRTPLGATGCFQAAPRCVQPGDPCGVVTAVDPVCDLSTQTWSCPSGSSPYVRAVDTPGVCLPFHDPSVPLQSLRGSLPRVPLDDGRCLWVGENAVTSGGATVSNMGFLVEPGATFGGCPTTATLAGGTPSSVVTLQSSDPTLVVQIAGAYRLAGQTRVLYRLFQQDASATFGVTLLGSGLASWDAIRSQIVVPGPSALLWGPDLDLGDASLVTGGTAYVWGCHAPFHELEDDCVLGRIDAQAGTQLYTGNGQWRTSTSVSDAAVVFQSASWFSSVFAAAGGGLEHAYVEAWGSTIQSHTAPAPEGPWSQGPDLAPCGLPTDDDQSYCTGAVAHLELQDPTRPGETVLSYSVGTLATDQTTRFASHPEKYWPRMVWVGP